MTGGIRGDSLTYNCVDAATEILTTHGRLCHGQVAAGDTALTLNAGTGIAEWQPVQAVYMFGDGPYPVVKMESVRHSSVTTPDHRWPVMFANRHGAAGVVRADPEPDLVRPAQRDVLLHRQHGRAEPPAHARRPLHAWAERYRRTEPADMRATLLRRKSPLMSAESAIT